MNAVLNCSSFFSFPVSVHSLEGDWSIFRRVIVFWRRKRRPKTWTCPLSRARGQSHFRGENVNSFVRSFPPRKSGQSPVNVTLSLFRPFTGRSPRFPRRCVGSIVPLGGDSGRGRRLRPRRRPRRGKHFVSLAPHRDFRPAACRRGRFRARRNLPENRLDSPSLPPNISGSPP